MAATAVLESKGALPVLATRTKGQPRSRVVRTDAIGERAIALLPWLAAAASAAAPAAALDRITPAPHGPALVQPALYIAPPL